MRRVLALVAVAMLACGLGGCASCSRQMKSLDSDMSGGLRRKVTLYDSQGEEIRSWEGMIDLSDSEEEVMFDLDGKRVIVHGGIVVVQEL